ncbi:MAG: hypothetical protein Q4B43_08570 [Bacteroidota bacterium]|nr:hypothetical protein [Bacteroidota bacterium]
MHVKIIFYLLGLLFSIIPALAQDKNSACVENFKVDSRTEMGANYLNDILVEWSYTTPKNKKVHVVIEVQPLDACWDKLEGINRGELRTYRFDDKSVKQLRIEHLDLNAKCLRWRAIITKGKCTEVTDWKFEQFV